MVKTTCVWLKEQRERLFVLSVALEAFSITTGYEPKTLPVFALRSPPSRKEVAGPHERLRSTRATTCGCR